MIIYTGLPFASVSWASVTPIMVVLDADEFVSVDAVDKYLVQKTKRMKE